MTKKEKRILNSLNDYVIACSEGLKSEKKVPNICGLCRHMGIGKSELLHMLDKNPELADRIFTVLEDETINSGASGTAFTQHLHLLDLFRAELIGEEKGSSGIIAVFGHEDGE